MSYLPPVILVALAVGAFVLYINPTYTSIEVVTADIAKYDDALDSAKEIMAVRDKLAARYNSFDPEDLKRLEKMLPKNVDNVRLIIDIDTLAAQYGMRLTSISVGETSVGTKVGEKLGPSGTVHQSVDIGFSTTSTYQNFRKFMRALETSLRIVDVKNLTFSSTSDGPDYVFQLSLSTYWLK